MKLVTLKRPTITQLIKQQKSKISKLGKRHTRIIKEIQSAEDLIETTLGPKLWSTSDELVSLNIGLERLMVAKHSSQGVRKARRAKK